MNGGGGYGEKKSFPCRNVRGIPRRDIERGVTRRGGLASISKINPIARGVEVLREGRNPKKKEKGRGKELGARRGKGQEEIRRWRRQKRQEALELPRSMEKRDGSRVLSCERIKTRETTGGVLNRRCGGKPLLQKRGEGKLKKQQMRKEAPGNGSP